MSSLNRGRRAFAAVAFGSLLLAAACEESAPSPVAPSVAVVGVRTFPVWRPTNGPRVTCLAVGIVNSVYGRLRINPLEPREPVWLESPAREHLSVIWPEGFSVQLAPTPALVDDLGRVVATSGGTVELQAGRDWAAGSFDDPYYAAWAIEAGDFPHDHDARGVTYNECYPREEGRQPP